MGFFVIPTSERSDSGGGEGRQGHYARISYANACNDCVFLLVLRINWPLGRPTRFSDRPPENFYIFVSTRTEPLPGGLVLVVASRYAPFWPTALVLTAECSRILFKIVKRADQFKYAFNYIVTNDVPIDYTPAAT